MKFVGELRESDWGGPKYIRVCANDGLGNFLIHSAKSLNFDFLSMFMHIQLQIKVARGEIGIVCLLD